LAVLAETRGLNPCRNKFPARVFYAKFPRKEKIRPPPILIGGETHALQSPLSRGHVYCGMAAGLAE
ncbi:MAG: hypothetical protein ACR2P5_06815, partial [Gammaproteobacteria bacterium]